MIQRWRLWLEAFALFAGLCLLVGCIITYAYQRGYSAGRNDQAQMGVYRRER